MCPSRVFRAFQVGPIASKASRDDVLFLKMAFKDPDLPPGAAHSYSGVTVGHGSEQVSEGSFFLMFRAGSWGYCGLQILGGRSGDPEGGSSKGGRDRSHHGIPKFASAASGCAGCPSKSELWAKSVGPPGVPKVWPTTTWSSCATTRRPHIAGAPVPLCVRTLECQSLVAVGFRSPGSQTTSVALRSFQHLSRAWLRRAAWRPPVFCSRRRSE